MTADDRPNGSFRWIGPTMVTFLLSTTAPRPAHSSFSLSPLHFLFPSLLSLSNLQIDRPLERWQALRAPAGGVNQQATLSGSACREHCWLPWGPAQWEEHLRQCTTSAPATTMGSGYVGGGVPSVARDEWCWSADEWSQASDLSWCKFLFLYNFQILIKQFGCARKWWDHLQ
jgi:hypothetical protein